MNPNIPAAPPRLTGSLLINFSFASC